MPTSGMIDSRLETVKPADLISLTPFFVFFFSRFPECVVYLRIWPLRVIWTNTGEVVTCKPQYDNDRADNNLI